MLLPILLIFSIVVSSCSHIPQSGHYIQLRPGETLDSLVKAFNTPRALISNSNPGKSFKTGEWIFIPTSEGVIAQILKRRKGRSDQNLFNGPFLWPVPTYEKISSYFGERDGRTHQGIDIPAPQGTYIVAAEDGVVINSSRELKGYGNVTIIAHGGNYYTVYAHARKNLTKKGQKVSRGEVIGEVGSTGRSSGPHLHFEIRKDDGPIDPMSYLGLEVSQR